MDDHFSHIGSGISLYHFTMFHYDVSILVLMMYGRMHSRTWDPGTPPHDVMRQLWDPGIPHLVGIIGRTWYPSYFDVLFWETLCMVEMHQHLDLGIPLSNLYVFTLCIDEVHKCWDLGIPYLRDLFLMTFYTRRVSKQWDPSIVDYGKLIGNTLWLVGLRKHTSSLLHGFIFAAVRYGFLHAFGWTYVFLTGCHDDFHVPLMHCIGEYILHLAFLRIIWNPGIIGT